MEKKSLEEFRRNVVFIDKLLRPINQGFLNPIRPTTLRGWFVHVWPIWYGSMWVVIYWYLILVHGKQAGLALISQQIWTVMALMQFVAKLVNGVFQVRKLQELFKWCENCYTMDYHTDVKVAVNGVFRKTNTYISTCIRIITSLVVSACGLYVIQPIVLRVRKTPTPISINGNDYWPTHIFGIIYLGQFINAIIHGCGLSAYDGVFIQCTMTMSYRFRTLKEVLNLLNYSGPRDDQRDRQILVDIYKMHLSVLDAIALFRSYYYLYGLVHLGTNLLINCTELYTLQTSGVDFQSVMVLMSSTAQVLMASAFGQLLQTEASHFCDALYETEWLEMSLANKKRLLMLMVGSKRVVNIRAGGTYELNLGLFAQVMKAGISLCAVMKAM